MSINNNKIYVESKKNPKNAGKKTPLLHQTLLKKKTYLLLLYLSSSRQSKTNRQEKKSKIREMPVEGKKKKEFDTNAS